MRRSIYLDFFWLAGLCKIQSLNKNKHSSIFNRWFFGYFGSNYTICKSSEPFFSNFHLIFCLIEFIIIELGLFTANLGGNFCGN